MLEADLYAPVKTHLEACGYAVRGEVQDCDIVGWDETHAVLVAVELKRGFGLPVLYQALSRLAAVDLVYVGVGVPEGARARARWDAQLREAIRLCRMLGVGLLSVRNGAVSIHADPGPYAPRLFAARRGKLLSEFRRRSGDHNVGGSSSRPRMTAYREDALRCATALQAAGGAMRPAAVRDQTGVAKAAAMLRRNVYHWFENIARGQYTLAPPGEAALLQYADIITAQQAAGSPAGLSAPPPRKTRARSTRLPTPENPRVNSPAAPAS